MCQRCRGTKLAPPRAHWHGYAWFGSAICWLMADRSATWSWHPSSSSTLTVHCTDYQYRHRYALQHTGYSADPRCNRICCCKRIRAVRVVRRDPRSASALTAVSVRRLWADPQLDTCATTQSPHRTLCMRSQGKAGEASWPLADVAKIFLRESTRLSDGRCRAHRAAASALARLSLA